MARLQVMPCCTFPNKYILNDDSNRQNKSKGDDAKRGPNKDDNKPKTISDFRLQFVSISNLKLLDLDIT